jgi:hypothetical protein
MPWGRCARSSYECCGNSAKCARPAVADGHGATVRCGDEDPDEAGDHQLEVRGLLAFPVGDRSGRDPGKNRPG